MYVPTWAECVLFQAAHGVTPPRAHSGVGPLTGHRKHLPFSPCTDGRTDDPDRQRRARWGPSNQRFLDWRSSITHSETHDWTPQSNTLQARLPNSRAGLWLTLAIPGLWVSLHPHQSHLRSHSGSVLLLQEGVALSPAGPTGMLCGD